MKMATTERTPRELDTRSKMERPTKWAPPALLPDPNPEPGFAFRWIRLSTLNAPDAINVSGKFREGWEPVKASDHPEITLMGGGSGRFPDGVEIGGLLLCKTPVEFVEQRDAHYRNIATSQMDSVDNNFMRENDPRMPLFKECQTKVSAFGKGN
jgi:hypothetical protein